MAANTSPAPAPAKEQTKSIVTLDEPIELAEGQPAITEVEVRKPAAGELRGMKIADLINFDVNAMMKLLPRITVPTMMEHNLAKMNVADFIALSTEVGLFLPQKAAFTDSPDA